MCFCILSLVLAVEGAFQKPDFRVCEFNYPHRRKSSKQSGIEHQQRVSVHAHM